MNFIYCRMKSIPVVVYGEIFLFGNGSGIAVIMSDILRKNLFSYSPEFKKTLNSSFDTHLRKQFFLQ